MPPPLFAPHRAGLIALCVLCLCWLGWQFAGSNLASAGSYARELAALRTQWQQPALNAGLGSSVSAVAARSGTAPGDVIGALRIPAFGADYEVPVVSGVRPRVLSRGIGHHPGSAGPGQVGNFVLAGHRVAHGQPFRRLLQLDAGNEVVVETREAVYTYVLDTAPRHLPVGIDSSWVLDPVPGHSGAIPSSALITLTTSSDLFGPPGRSVAFGHLLDTSPKN